MFRNKMAFLGVATVMATAVVPAMAQSSMSSVQSGGVVNLSNNDLWTYNIQASSITRGLLTSDTGKLVMFRSTNDRVGMTVAINKLQWFSATSCVASGTLQYENAPAHIEFFLSKEAGKNYASWQISRASDKVVLYDTGSDANKSLIKNALIYGTLTLNAPR